MFGYRQSSRRYTALLLVLALVVALTTVPLAARPVFAAASSYFVDSLYGSDNYSGTSPTSPWQTMTKLNKRSFGPGDTINLARGSTWIGGGNGTSTLTINGGGAAGRPIIIQPYDSGQPNASNSAPVISNPASVSQPAQGITVNAAYVTIQNLSFVNIREAGIMLYGNNAVITNNDIGSTGAGIEARGQGGTITYNTIHDGIIAVDDGAGNSWGGNGIMINNGGGYDIAHNRFINCVAASSQAGGLDGGAVEFFGSVSNVSIHHNYANNVNGFTEVGSQGGTDSDDTIADNVIVNAGPIAGIHVGGTWATFVSNMKVINNTIISTNSTNGPNYLYLDGGRPRRWKASNLVVRNNIFYNSGATMGLTQNPGVQFTHDHNSYYGLTYIQISLDKTEMVTDPKFVDFANGDYHLQPGSPAIDAALSPAPYSTDYDGCGVPVGSGLDIGAYEYGGTPA